jgi:hypothetical protein
MNEYRKPQFDVLGDPAVLIQAFKAGATESIPVKPADPGDEFEMP